MAQRKIPLLSQVQIELRKNKTDLTISVNKLYVNVNFNKPLHKIQYGFWCHYLNKKYE